MIYNEKMKRPELNKLYGRVTDWDIVLVEFFYHVWIAELSSVKENI